MRHERILDDPQGVEALENNLIEAATAFWGEKVRDFVVSRATDTPFRMLTLDFTIYNYSRVRLTVERRLLWVGDVSSGLFLQLLPHFDATLFSKRLYEIDAEVRLRIPDKYLEAKGW